MGSVTYRDGIAILQLIVFPFIFAASLFIWKKTGWRVGSRIWRYPATLSLIRIAGSICTLLTITNKSRNVIIGAYVCELIGIAPLLLTYIGVLRQIDTEERIPRRGSNLIAIVTIIGLILGIAGVSEADDNGDYKNNLTMAAMGIFLAVFVIFVLMTIWLWLQTHYNLRVFQKKLFLAVAISIPFVLVRVVYSALSDYSDISRFQINGSDTVYLCMSVLEEIVAMVVTVGLGTSAVLQKDFVKFGSSEQSSEPKIDAV
ncbi:hypothetical protein N7452_006924 [Penicillium brevicompactum]|uniref:DUF7702 domain-containing protein n=1 Tax=Penicillium brevicompactum TaxID=5074 RepID=A0A9W9QH11_PENBR|nr:hypothetical protein N7452_006924 [Penicillium brevicompactum]